MELYVGGNWVMPDNEFVSPVKLNFLRNQSLDELLLEPEGIISSDAL